MRIYLFFTFILFFFKNLATQDYYSDRLFVKIKPQYIHDYQLIKDKRLLKALNETNLLLSKQVSKHPLLSSVYELIFDSTASISPLMEDMNSWEEIEYAERVPLYKLFFTPNDPLYSTQWNLVKIQADLAWNLGQGCTQVKIAVTDDGFLMNHEDLVNQWHINTGEVNGNGIDDDGNGYIDDWRGWDAANNDNDPSAFNPTNSYFTHGTHVAGIVAGQTHNSKGIAAIGYNCKMIPVKIGLDANSSLTGAFQGLDFAINASGCDVINMSWGGGGWSATFQTLFNIAKSKGIICVAAAGNSNTSAPMYPASYNHVISVAASASSDVKANFSNFGSAIDVTAPGVNIPSCLAGATNAYGNFSGTSMASPLVAGLCALMKCYNPMPADSIEACLKRTCDNINAQNPSFIGQLGAGRINAFQALQCLTKKPKSDFIALDTFQCIGKSVRYAAKSFGIPTLTYNWSFPGGTPASSTAANPIVTYSSNGYKSATLITCNSLGCDTMTKMNLVYIDTPKAWLNGRVYTTINAMNISLAVHFRGNPPYQVTLTDGTNVWTQSNIKANPYFFSIQPKKDTSHIFISSFTDSLCSGSGAGRDTIYRKNLTKDTTICLTLKTSQNGALDGFGFTPASSTNITWTFTNNENVVANWTSAGSPHFWRCILKFNLSYIPANAVINSASLSMYSKPNATHGWSGQPTAGTNNSTSISRITNTWNTSSIATNAWPSTTTQNQVILAQSPTNNHSYTNVDVKNLIQDLITNGDNGILLRHVNTPFYNSLIFYSAEETDTSKHPKLVICYTIPAGGSGGGGSSDCDTTGLILCMSMDGNANDSTKYAHHGIIRGATPTNNRFGSSNSAYAFNGISNYINLGNKSLLKPNKATISMWVKPNTPSTHGYGYAFNPLMVTGNTNTPGNMCEAYFIGVSSSGNNKFHASSWNPATSSSGGGPSIQSYSINTWYHLTAIFDNDSVRIYINGNLDKSYFKGFSTNYSSLDSIIIGYSGNNTSNQRWFNGAIDDVKMYNRVLTASEVQSLYTKPFTCSCSSTPPPSDCDTTNLNTGKVLHLDFNGNTHDKSGNGNHATNYGATPVAGKDGVANTAYRFDGVNDYMIVTHSSSINIGNQATLTAKLKINGFYSGVCHGNMIMTKGTSNHHFVYSPSGYNGGNCVANLDTLHQNVFCSSSASVNNSSYLPFLEKNKWYCLVYTQKNDSAYIFMDGILVHRQYNNSTNNTDDLSIGRYMSSVYPYWINADVDDIRIYNRALAPSEVKGYCGTCTPSQPPLCDTSRSFAYTQCLNDSLQVNLRPGSQYQWSPKLGLSSDTVANPKVYINANQRYLVSYIGLRGCQVVDTIDISVRNSAIYPNMDDQLICIGDSVQMTIPIFATAIVWSPNLSISSINAKNPYFFPTTNRTYYLEFRDTFGCLHRDTFIVNTKVCCPARARFTIPKDMLCFGETLRPINTSKGPITSYNWNFGTANPNSFAGVNPPSISFPSGGSYSLRLIVTNGICFDTMIKTVNVVHIIPNAGKDTTNCLGAFVTDLGEAPISDWSYKWTPTKYLDDPKIANPKCSIVNDSVNYILEITDRNSGCKAYDTVVVYTNRKIDSTVQNLRICGGDSVLFNGVQRKTTGNYYFTLKKADGFCDSFINVLRLNVLQKQMIKYIDTGVCEVYIDKKGRRYYDSFTEYDTIRSRSIPNCDSIVNYRNIKINKTIFKSRTISGCAPLRFNGKNYTVSKSKVDSLRTRSVMFPCDSIIEYVNVVVYPKPKAEITPSIPNPVMYKQTVTLTASGGQTYLWLQTGSTNQDIDYKINNTQPKLYTVRVTDENDCWDTVSYLIKGILPDTCYYGFPNVFSPNQDNLNDEYIPNMDECTEIKVFAIYDRWGEKVFETNQLKGWNGTFKGKPAQLGVYLYYAELFTPWGIKTHKGTFTLVR